MVSFLILKIFSKTLKGNTLIVNSVILFLLQQVIFLSSAQCKNFLGERELIYTITESLHDITNSFRRTHLGASLEIYFRNISCSFVGFQTFVVLVSMNVCFFFFFFSDEMWFRSLRDKIPLSLVYPFKLLRMDFK